MQEKVEENKCKGKGKTCIIGYNTWSHGHNVMTEYGCEIAGYFPTHKFKYCPECGIKIDWEKLQAGSPSGRSPLAQSDQD